MIEKEQDYAEWSRETIAHFEWYAGEKLPTTGHEPRKLIGSMRYSVLNGGKRIRAQLIYAAGLACGAPMGLLDAGALALECIHGYSLVHDDMPSMDNDTLRRGKPTTHVMYGEALAMLAGDALQTEAFDVLASEDADPVKTLRMVRTLARASGVRGMAGGQALDLAMVGKDPAEFELMRMQTMKTGALILASILMGAQAGRWDELGEDARAGFARFGHAIGLLFQVVDDILDCTQNTETLGKTAGKDAKDDKPTWVSFKGLDGARAFADELYGEALSALAAVEADPVVGRGGCRYLEAIARLVKERSH